MTAIFSNLITRIFFYFGEYIVWMDGVCVQATSYTLNEALVV